MRNLTNSKLSFNFKIMNYFVMKLITSFLFVTITKIFKYRNFGCKLNIYLLFTTLEMVSRKGGILFAITLLASLQFAKIYVPEGFERPIFFKIKYVSMEIIGLIVIIIVFF